MKANFTLLLLFFLFLAAPAGHCQIELPEETLKALDDYDKTEEVKNPQIQKGNDVSERQKKEWQEQWEQKKEQFSELSDYSSNKALNCILLMVLYLDGYFELVDRTEHTSDCRTKYDLYGMQAIALSTSTTIMYCPESLANKSIEDLKDLWEVQLRFELEKEDKPDALKLWEYSLARVASGIKQKNLKIQEILANPEILHSIILLYSPEFILPELLQINRRMEALDCGYY